MKTKRNYVVRYNPSDRDLHPQLKILLGGRKIWKEKVTNPGYEDEIITWTFADGTVESYKDNNNGVIVKI
jgi:hypothetical protein